MRNCPRLRAEQPLLYIIEFLSKTHREGVFGLRRVTEVFYYVGVSDSPRRPKALFAAAREGGQFVAENVPGGIPDAITRRHRHQHLQFRSQRLILLKGAPPGTEDYVTMFLELRTKPISPRVPFRVHKFACF